MAETTADNAPGNPIGVSSGTPRVSVVMTVYGDRRFLDEAVDSILRQDFRDLELVIVDDGTGEDAVFMRLAERDARIRIVVNAVNLGTAAAANRGIDAARADIIARLDADDIAEPTRIGRLLAALDADPQLGLVGSWFTTIDEAGAEKEVIRMPETDLEIRWAILFGNPFCHSSVAYRRRCFEAAGGYPADRSIPHDHYLWSHMLSVCRARNVPEALVRYRLNPRGLTTTHASIWRARAHALREQSWARLGVVYGVSDDRFVFDLAQFVSGYDIARVEGRPAAYRTILKLLRPFLAAAEPFAREEDAAAAHRLAQTTVARILADPPTDLRTMIEICRLCWPLDRRATIAALRRRLVGEIRPRWQAVKDALRRLRPR